jgi:hypothetical protein
MPCHHSPDQKADSLERLQANGGDIASTSFQTGIPQRTLYTWRQELWLQQVQRWQTLPVPSLKIERPQFDDAVDELLYLRGKVMNMLTAVSDTIMERLPTHGNTPWMFDRIRAQNGLLDCVMKLDAFLKPRLAARREVVNQSAISLPGWLDWDEDEGEEEYGY